MALYILYESAPGLALFQRVESEEVGLSLESVQQSISDLSRFSRIVKKAAFLPFPNAETALDTINRLSEGEVSDFVKNFLETNLPKAKPGKLSKFSLGVIDPRIGNILQETMGIKCQSNDVVAELLRGIRLHFHHMENRLKPADIQQAQLGLSHAYSRSKVKFNVNKVDNMIIQSIALLDQLDKDLNTFTMRVREWYSWHFPELYSIVNDGYMFCRVVSFVKHKSTLNEEMLPGLEEILGNADAAKQVLEAARMSMGTDLSEIDMINIERFSQRVIELAEYRAQLHKYLISKMNQCAPNLAALIGEQVGARLISHAGSLTNLAKYPASTVQILGAEKALFRALKTRGNTPKYGLIFHSSFIGRAAPKNKGRISRYLANKCSLAARIDCFSEQSTNKFGDVLREQVEERLEFYKSGKAPRKNAEVMTKAISDLGGDITNTTESKEDQDKPKKKKKDKKRQLDAAAAETPHVTEESPAKKLKKEKKKEKREKADKAALE